MILEEKTLRIIAQFETEVHPVLNRCFMFKTYGPKTEIDYYNTVSKPRTLSIYGSKMETYYKTTGKLVIIYE